jgi:diadenosine tetraphosphate (Ap4A) HIT family hydrolase
VNAQFETFTCVMRRARAKHIWHQIQPAHHVCTLQHVHVHIIPRKGNDFPQNDDVYREVWWSLIYSLERLPLPLLSIYRMQLITL